MLYIIHTKISSLQTKLSLSSLTENHNQTCFPLFSNGWCNVKEGQQDLPNRAAEAGHEALEENQPPPPQRPGTPALWLLLRPRRLRTAAFRRPRAFLQPPRLRRPPQSN